MRYELCEQIACALKDRDTWERRQETWYKMRHEGLRRVAPPYKGAADLHFPLIDSLIERLKPFYYQQLYGRDQFATFVSLKTQPADTTSAVGGWFDYRLKNKTNLERKILTGIDHMCMAGRSVLKCYWDFEKKEICFISIPPSYFVVPHWVDDLQEEWCVHILLMSKDVYKKNKNFRQDDEFVKTITGKVVGDYGITSGLHDRYQSIKRREGITIAKEDNQIVLYEIYHKKNDGVCFDTFSPMRMEEGDQVRDTQYLPADETDFPFVSFRSEIKDEGWYSPRGVPEIVASFEDSLCRDWNFKHDWMDYFNRPLFKNTSGIGNTQNPNFLPGSTLPQGIEPVESKAPPLSFDQEMQTTRALAEYRMAIPDIGATSHLQGRPTARGDVTATQVNAIVGQSQLSDDMRSRVFRLDLGDLFKRCWFLYKKYDRQSLTYVLFDTVGELPPDAFEGEYEINPNGSAESWNKPQQMQKAITRLQMFRGSPFWKQNELEKSVMELDDPRMIRRAYTDPGQELKLQMEVQAQEISIMLLGFPATVQMSDDDKAHIQSTLGYVDRSMAVGPQLTPEQARLFVQHCGEHDQALQQKKDPALNQIRQAAAPYIDFLSNLAMMDAQAPANVVPGPGATPGGSLSSPPGGAQGALSEDPIGDATKVMNSLADLLKTGVPVTIEQLNEAMAKAGLPPFHEGTVATPPPTPPEPKTATGPPK